MALLSTACANACEWPPRLQLLCAGVLAALLALNVDAMRLDRGAASSDGALVAALASRASIPLEPDSAAARAQRDRDLRTAQNYLESINVNDYRHLGNVKNTLERLENIRERVLSFGTARDARHRLQIRSILRDVREHGEALRVLVAKLEAEGHVDDGGDELPTQRDSICRRISKYLVEATFVELVQFFCESLDSVRKSVNASEDEEPMAYCVSGLLNTIVMKSDYQQSGVGWEIEQMLGEERRWVAKHLPPQPAGAGNAVHLPQGTTARFRSWSLRAWETRIWADVDVDTAALPSKALKQARDVLVSATVEDDLTLSSVRTRIQRIDFCKERLAHFISRSDPAFLEQVREVLQKMKARKDQLHALAARKVAASEVDNSSEALPSQRHNICMNLDAFGLEGDFSEDVRKLCETFDRLHIVVKVEPEKDKCMFEVLGRMGAIERRPGYSDMLVAKELENLLAEEWSWLAQQEAAVGA